MKCAVFLILDSPDVVFAASVLAASAVVRSLFGAAFPLFTNQMYESLGIHWAASIPAFLALACIPCPLIFYKYGHRIRARCKFAAEAARVLEEMRADNREIDESEAEEEVHQQDRMEKLVKSMSKQSRRSHHTRKGDNAAVPAFPDSSNEVVREEVVREKKKEDV